MKYFKKGDQVFAFEDDGSQDHLITEDMISITEEEANEIINPPKTQSELYDTELSQINVAYQKKVEMLSIAYGRSGLFDGSDEQSKKQDIYQQLLQANNQYLVELAALDEKYGG